MRLVSSIYNRTPGPEYFPGEPAPFNPALTLFNMSRVLDKFAPRVSSSARRVKRCVECGARKPLRGSTFCWYCRG